MLGKKFFLLVFVALVCNILHAQILTSSGGGGAYSIPSYPGNFTSYYDGFSVIFRANHTNPGGSTMSIAGQSAINIVNTAGNPLSANDILNGQIVTLVYDASGGRFQMITTSGNLGGGGSVSGGGTASYIPRWATAATLGNSVMWDDGTNIGIGNTSPQARLHIQKNVANGTPMMWIENTVGTGETNLQFKTSGGALDYLELYKGGPSASGSIDGIPLANLSYLSTGVNAGPLMLRTVVGHPIYFLTNNLTRMTLDATGNLGIGNTGPAARLDVTGQMYSRGFNAGASATIDWNNSNTQTTSAAPGTFTFTNLLDGGEYTLFCTSAASGTYTFSQAGLTFIFTPPNAATSAGTTTRYQFRRMGTNVYVYWGTVGAAAGGASLWTDGGPNIYPSTISDNVNIGTTGTGGNGAADRLEVSGNTELSGTVYYSGGPGGTAVEQVGGSTGIFSWRGQLRTVGNLGNPQLLVLREGGARPTEDLLQIFTDNSITRALTVSGDGNTGIGTPTPQNKLDVFSNSTSSAGTGQLRLSNGNDYTYFNSFNDLAGNSMMDINQMPASGTDNVQVRLFRKTTTTGTVYFSIHDGTGAATQANVALSGNSNSFINVNTGNVGIGNTAAAEKLDVTGNVQFSGALMPNSDAGTSGQALVSQGMATAPVWQNIPATLPAGSASQTVRYNGGWVANSFLWNTGAAIGINTTGPLSTLDVNGGLAVGTYAGTSAAPANGLLVSGNVGIGTNAPGTNKLLVDGSSASFFNSSGPMAVTIGGSLLDGNTLSVDGPVLANTTTFSPNAMLAVKDGHIQSQQSAGSPTTIAAGAALGGGTFSLSNATDVAGKIVFTPSGTSIAGVMVTVTFGKSYATTPIVSLTPANNTAAQAAPQKQVYVTNVTATSFQVAYIVAPPGAPNLSGIAHHYYYHVIETQ